MVTPLRERDTLDAAGLERLIEHILRGGVRGLFILGTTGEAPSLSYRLRREVIDRVCAQVRGRVPVLVGITDTAFVEAVNLARHAAESGANALVTSAPYYLPAGQAELIEYVDRLVPELPLPLYLYNMPQLTKVQFEIATLRQLARHERIAGVKDSSGNLDYLSEVVALGRERPDWSVLVGPEHLLLDTLRRGGHGGVNGGANLWPELFVGLHAAFQRGDELAVNRLQAQLLQLGAIYQVGRHASAVVKGIKCALSLLGICNDFMAEPFNRFRLPERDRVQALLESLGVTQPKL